MPVQFLPLLLQALPVPPQALPVLLSLARVVVVRKPQARKAVLQLPLARVVLPLLPTMLQLEPCPWLVLRSLSPLRFKPPKKRSLSIYYEVVFKRMNFWYRLLGCATGVSIVS